MNQQILDSIPHRPPFLFIDEMTEVTENGARSRRSVQANEYYFEGHYPGNPIMPGVLLCEAVFQTAAVYLSGKIRETGEDINSLTPVLSKIQDARFKSMVKPGDVIDIETSIKESMGNFHFMKGKITNKGKTALTIDFTLAVIKE